MQVNRKRIVINTFLLYGKTLITLVVSLYSTRLILSAMGELDFGIYGTVGGAIAMLSVLNLAMTRATQRFMNYAEGGDDRERQIAIFNNTVLLHWGLGLLIVLLMLLLYYPMFQNVLNIPIDRLIAAEYIYVFLIISTFFSIISVPYDALINAHEDFLYYSIVGIVISVLKLIVAFVITYTEQDRLILYGLLLSGLEIVNMMVMRIYCKIRYEECVFCPRRYANMSVAKEIGIFSGWNFVGALSNMAGNHGSNILMNHYFGAAIIASKNIGDQISTIVSVLTSNLTKALTPSIVKSEGGGDRLLMIDLSLKSGRFGLLLYFVLAIPFIYNSESLLGLWLEKIPDWAVLFCQLQVFRVIMEQLFASLSTMLIAEGTIRHMNIIDLVLGIVTFVVIGIAYRMGLGATWHYYISIGVLVFLSGISKLYLCHRFCNLNVSKYFKEVFCRCSFVVVIAITFCVLSANIMNGFHVLITVTIQACAIFIIEILFGLSKQEKVLLLSEINKYFGR